MALCPRLPRWAGTRKVKPIWILLKQETVSGSGISWAICKSAPRSRQITTPVPHHSQKLVSVQWNGHRWTRCELLTEEVGEELWLSVELDGDEDGIEKDEYDDEPVEHLWLDDVPHLEPSHAPQHTHSQQWYSGGWSQLMHRRIGRYRRSKHKTCLLLKNKTSLILMANTPLQQLIAL